MKPSPSFINAQGAHVKRGSLREEQFLQLTTPLRPTRLLRLPWDPRSVYAAEENLLLFWNLMNEGFCGKSSQILQVN